MEILAEAVKMFVGNKEILKGIDFSLHNKEFLGIIGPNGSGKSTFLKCVYRVQKPTSGDIYFDGKHLDELSYRESALKLAVVAQHNFYSFDFSVLDVVLWGVRRTKKCWSVIIWRILKLPEALWREWGWKALKSACSLR